MSLVEQLPVLQVTELLREKRGMLPVKEKQALLSAMECTEDQLMLALLTIASERAVVPLSGFKVGAVVLGETGNLYLGANQELGHAALNEAMHAEQAAVAVAHCHGETNITKIVINYNPCGHCRQFLFECSDGGQIDVLVTDQASKKLSVLLPHAFGPKDLHIDIGLLTPQAHELELDNASTDPLILAALQAASRSYSPYNRSYSGMALQTLDGNIFAGSYLENVAFNPSLSAIQTAFALLVQSGYSYQDVIAGAFLQIKTPAIDLVPATQLLFAGLCQNAHGNLRIDELKCAN